MTKPETDDLKILLQYNPDSSIKFIPGSEKNFKVTTKDEVSLLEQLYKDKKLWKKLYE